MEKDAVILVFSEFGQRIKDNGSGCDHGSDGVAFVIGGSVNGGLYGEYLSLQEKDRLEGDLYFADHRGILLGFEIARDRAGRTR